MAVKVAGFRAVERSYFDLRWHLDPVAASQAGVFTHDQRYGRFSPDAIAPHLAALKAIASALEESTAADLDAEIDRTALLNEVRVTLRRFAVSKAVSRFMATHGCASRTCVWIAMQCMIGKIPVSRQ